EAVVQFAPTLDVVTFAIFDVAGHLVERRKVPDTRNQIVWSPSTSVKESTFFAWKARTGNCLRVVVELSYDRSRQEGAHGQPGMLVGWASQTSEQDRVEQF